MAVGVTNVKIPEAFKALGDPVRLEIVRRLVGRELCVCDILDAFKLSQPTISHLSESPQICRIGDRP
jgi:DNA-binding transcriptional ArsR family regulator